MNTICISYKTYYYYYNTSLGLAEYFYKHQRRRHNVITIADDNQA